LIVYVPDLAYSTLPFSDNFEADTWKNSWAWRSAELTAGAVNNVTRPSNVVDIAAGIGSGSNRAVRMGKRCDDGMTTNALDLHLNLAGQTQVEMTFDIFDNDEENHTQDGLYFSDNGGLTFRKVFSFLPESWCNQYGTFPPFDIDDLAAKAGLALTDKFIIRFQQHDDGDFFNSGIAADGLYIDDVNVYVPTITYANLPFTDRFESGSLGENWKWRFADATALPALNVSKPSNIVEAIAGTGFNSNYAVALGKRCDDGLTTNALDLHLNLAGQTQVEMTFDIFDNDEENHTQDGLYFSDNGGLTFRKVFSFLPESWCNQYGAFPPLDVDDLAAKAGLKLTDKFIIRFQQHDDGDFFNSGIAADGLYLDNVEVYTSVRRYATLPFEDDFERPNFDAAWAWSFADKTVATGVSNFSRPSNIVTLASGVGRQSNRAVLMGKRCDDGEATNALDLHLNLNGMTQVEMTFWIFDNDDESQPSDGIYFSNDGGESFKKVLDLLPATWCNQYGSFPPLDIDELAAKANLPFTDRFVIRFQQHDDGDFFNSGVAADGFYLDDVEVYVPTITYANLPFTDGFESGSLGEHWKWRFADATALPALNVSKPSNIVEVIPGIGFNSNHAVALGKRCDDGIATNALDLHANLQDKRGVVLTFKIFDNGDQNNPQDGIYFSNNGGATFTKVADFLYNNLPNNTYADFRVNVDSLITRFGLSWTSNFIIRFQQHDIGDFFNSGVDARGIYLDNIQLRAGITSTDDLKIEDSAIIVFPNPTTDFLTLHHQNTAEHIRAITMTDVLGSIVIQQQINATNTVLDLTNLHKGVYLLKIESTAGRVGVRKVVRY
jgi:Secretion system C-terminal sorting domain